MIVVIMMFAKKETVGMIQIRCLVESICLFMSLCHPPARMKKRAPLP